MRLSNRPATILMAAGSDSAEECPETTSGESGVLSKIKGHGSAVAAFFGLHVVWRGTRQEATAAEQFSNREGFRSVAACRVRRSTLTRVSWRIVAAENSAQEKPAMPTLNLQEAAALLRLHPTTLAARAKAGLIPGAKLGRRWVFLDVDLIEYLRGRYAPRALQGERTEVSVCHSTNAKTHRTGGSRSPTVEAAYSEALGLPTARRPGSTTTS